MPLRCSKRIYFIMGLWNRAVSHWAAKDATLSLQGHMSEPQAAWDRIKAATGHKLTDYFSSSHHSSDSYPSILRDSWVCAILIIWYQKFRPLWPRCWHTLYVLEFSSDLALGHYQPRNQWSSHRSKVEGYLSKKQHKNINCYQFPLFICQNFLRLHLW